MTSKQRSRKERAAEMLMKKINNPDHEYKKSDGKQKAELCLSNLRAKGIK